MPERLEEPIHEDYEFDVHQKSFTIASDRVRHLMLTSVIASILVFAGYRNANDQAWMTLRVDRVRVAERNAVWEPDIDKKLAACQPDHFAAVGFKDPCKDVGQAVAWYRASGHGENSLKQTLDAIEHARVTEMQIVKVPFLGIEFDINDLGAFSAIGLAAIAVVLCYSMVRYYENLYLSLWRIRRVAEKEGRVNDSQSTANFLYHTLAMGQVFSRAPTLARWKNHVGLSRLPSLLLLIVPVIVQGIVYKHDWATRPQGRLFSEELTNLTVWGIETPFSLVLLVSTVLSFIYALAADKRWAATFFALNPSLRQRKPSSWLTWVFPTFFPRFRIDDGQLYLVDKVSGKVNEVIERHGREAASLKEITDFPEDFFDSARLKDGSVYTLQKTDQGQVKVTKHLGTDRVNGRRVRVGDVFRRSKDKSLFDLYYAEGDRINRASSDQDEELLVAEIERQVPPRRGRRFSDIACNGEEVFALEDRGTTLWRIVAPPKTEEERVGSLFWAPVALACFGGQLFVAELPRLLLRWTIGWWKPVRVRRVQFTGGTSPEPTERKRQPSRKSSENPGRKAERLETR
jgi:hypothetical protein